MVVVVVFDAQKIGVITFVLAPQSNGPQQVMINGNEVR